MTEHASTAMGGTWESDHEPLTFITNVKQDALPYFHAPEFQYLKPPYWYHRVCRPPKMRSKVSTPRTDSQIYTSKAYRYKGQDVSFSWVQFNVHSKNYKLPVTRAYEQTYSTQRSSARLPQDKSNPKGQTNFQNSSSGVHGISFSSASFTPLRSLQLQARNSSDPQA